MYGSTLRQANPRNAARAIVTAGIDVGAADPGRDVHTHRHTDTPGPCDRVVIPDPPGHHLSHHAHTEQDQDERSGELRGTLPQKGSCFDRFGRSHAEPPFHAVTTTAGWNLGAIARRHNARRSTLSNAAARRPAAATLGDLTAASRYRPARRSTACRPGSPAPTGRLDVQRRPVRRSPRPPADASRRTRPARPPATLTRRDGGWCPSRSGTARSRRTAPAARRQPPAQHLTGRRRPGHRHDRPELRAGLPRGDRCGLDVVRPTAQVTSRSPSSSSIPNGAGSVAGRSRSGPMISRYAVGPSPTR